MSVSIVSRPTFFHGTMQEAIKVRDLEKINSPWCVDIILRIIGGLYHISSVVELCIYYLFGRCKVAAVATEICSYRHARSSELAMTLRL